MYKECAGSAGFGGSEPEEHFIHAGNTRELRLYQGLFGFCVGDALGVPVEFSDRRKRIRFGRCAHTEHITSRPEPGLMIHP